MTTLPARAPHHTGSQLRTDHKVTWLELFFDLVFVAAVAQVAEPLREHYTFEEMKRFTPLFLLIWWAWTGRAVFSTRFDTGDAIQRLLTLVEMFAVAVMAANARASLVSRDSAGFAAAYAAVRVALLVHYMRARQHARRAIRDGAPEPLWQHAGALASRHAVGHGVAAVLWLTSAVVPADMRLAVWTIAFAIDLATPWVTVEHSVHVPPHAAHLPERFGLFTLILLGESVVAVMRGIESQEGWTLLAASSAIGGMATLFGIWWWYFERVRAAQERPIRSTADVIRLHVWSYAHFPLSLAVIVIGVGIQRAVTAVHRASPPVTDVILWVTAAIVLVASMQVIAATSRRRPSSSRGDAHDWSDPQTAAAL